jgi:hypothetical protein
MVKALCSEPGERLVCSKGRENETDRWRRWSSEKGSLEELGVEQLLVVESGLGIGGLGDLVGGRGLSATKLLYRRRRETRVRLERHSAKRRGFRRR